MFDGFLVRNSEVITTQLDFFFQWYIVCKFSTSLRNCQPSSIHKSSPLHENIGSAISTAFAAAAATFFLLSISVLHLICVRIFPIFVSLFPTLASQLKIQYEIVNSTYKMHCRSMLARSIPINGNNVQPRE